MALSINYTLTPTGSEGSTITVPELVGMTILLCFKGDKQLTYVASAPTANQYSFDAATGIVTFGNELENDQVVQIIYRSSI